MTTNGIYNDSVGDVDIIFAGGGTAACVAAGRLAKANPDLKILLIEGGPNNYQNPTITNPAFYLSHLVPDSKTALFYKSKSSEYLNGREAIVPMGGCLGGGSSINFMMYTRAQGVDYDSFKTEGWYAKDLIPLSNKLETYHPKGEGHDPSKHGHEGPINISDGGFRSKGGDQFLEAAKEVGHEVIVDLQDFEANGGFSSWQRYVSPDGKRQDAAHCYIHPLIQGGQHPNLHILPESKVIRVIFDESSPPRAVGVEYKPNSHCQPSLSLSKPVHKTIKANKLVVVSAGALGSPQVLERSGVGSPEVLKKAGVERVVADVPGVGENYQDHHLILYPYKTSLPERETIDALLSGRRDFMKAIEEKDPILGWNAIDACAKIRPTNEEIAALGPEFQEDWDVEFAKAPTRPLMLCGMVSAFLADPTLVEPGQYITLGAYTAYPFSRGRIHITSAEDVLTGYEFDTGFLNHRADIKKQLWAYKMQREIARRLPFYRGELELGHPKFPSSSAAALVSIDKDAADAKPNSIPGNDRIQYSKEDDELIEDWIRGNLNTTWHSMSTCSMKPREKGGVVDKDLNVYGTVGLKVADLSICPENVGANTNNTALVVGEKAAVIIGEELGIEV